MPTSRSNKTPRVLITMGDGRGIGPEVIAGALSRREVSSAGEIAVVGDAARMAKAAKIMHVKAPPNILHVHSKGATAPLLYIDTALALIKKGLYGGLATGPVNKESITAAGVRFVGHTEYLAAAVRAPRVAMMFTGGKNLRVTTVTRHIPLRRVGRALTMDKITDAAVLTYAFLKERAGIRRPRLGICALNPHAGEGGLIGREEIEKIAPAVKKLTRSMPGISGPLPADSAFNLLYRGCVDGLVAMYHDQAMIPVKMVGRESCVNVTLGLPFVRTTPVHGTAYDIAGKGIADPSGMAAAIRMACDFA